MPRKTWFQVGCFTYYYVASMRPRPDAAENLDLTGDLDVDGAAASMRPRPDAAENAREVDRWHT